MEIVGLFAKGHRALIAGLIINPTITADMGKNPKNKVVLYARVSTTDQDASDQLRRLREWATRMDLEIVAEFNETASGRLVRRPEQDKVMKIVRGHHTHAVAVAKLDRWGRSLIDLRNSIQIMVDNGVKFHAVEQGITYEKNSAIGNLLLNQLASIAEFEVDLISQRTKEGLAARTVSGKPWISKSGRKVERLGRPNSPCHDCGGERTNSRRAKRGGRLVPICEECRRPGLKPGERAVPGPSSTGPAPLGVRPVDIASSDSDAAIGTDVPKV